MRLNTREQMRLSNRFSQGIASAAVALNAAIIDGGTSIGVMKMMGAGVARSLHPLTLIGVASADEVISSLQSVTGNKTNGVTLDANHSHFVLMKGGTWGCETKTIYRLAKALSDDIPVVTILADSGSICKQEALQAVRHGWPIIISEGSKGEADRLARLWRRKTSFSGRWLRLSISDPVEAEIIASGKIILFPITGSYENLYQLARDQTLKRAWELFAHYDEYATKQHKHYKREQVWLLWLGIVSVALVMSQRQGLPTLLPWLNLPLHYAIVLVPILTSLLLSVVSRFNAGNKWVMLGGNASVEPVTRIVWERRERDRNGRVCERSIYVACVESKNTRFFPEVKQVIVRKEVKKMTKKYR